MFTITKSKETMSSKERVQKTFNYEKTDRVTIGYDANPTIHKKLCEALGVDHQNYPQLCRALGVDYIGAGASYKGKPLFENVKCDEGKIVNQEEGCVCRWVANDYGGYWDYCDFPLRDADEEEYFNYPVPDPDDYDYDGALDFIKSLNSEFAVYIGNGGMPDVINGIGRIAGMEDVLCLLATEDEGLQNLIERRTRWQTGVLERLLNKCKGEIDFMWIGEDLGTQIAPMISPDLYKTALKPVHKQFADLAHAYNVPIIIHSCGSSSWAYEDFIDIGINGVDTIQPEAVNMSPEYIADTFGGRLNFRGCISTAGPLAYGTTDEVTDVCRETLEIMKKVKGYHFAPTHMIQDNTPVENIVAMYNAAHKYGTY